jgi:hypothetical protein
MTPYVPHGTLAVVRSDHAREGIEQLVGGIRRARALEAEVRPFTPAWYDAFRVEAELIHELRSRYNVMDVETLEWVVAQK